MEDQEIVDLDYTGNTPGSRPTFITVLCILSWIMIGIGLLINVPSLLSPETGQIGLEKELENLANDPNMNAATLAIAEEFFNSYIDNFSQIQLGTVLGYLFELFGVYLIFNLRKVGFYIYLGASIIYLLPLFAFLPLGNFFSIFMIFMFGIPCVVFSILYAVNLKHLK